MINIYISFGRNAYNTFIETRVYAIYNMRGAFFLIKINLYTCFCIIHLIKKKNFYILRYII